jgi:hypothetical protein
MSLHQPWASLVALGLKKVETRGPRSPRAFRGPLLIHAAKRWTQAQADTLAALSFEFDLPHLVEKCAPQFGAPAGALVAVARVIDIRLMTPEWIAEQTPLERAVGDWQPGRYGWVLEDVVPLDPPIGSVRGRQGLFNLKLVQELSAIEAARVARIVGELEAKAVARGG